MKKVLGTYDVYGEYADKMRQIETYLYSVCELYNFQYIRTPILEETSLYHRDENNTDDKVIKHTYDFEDLSGKKITLRPENNSGIVRAVIENKLYDRPRKFYYYGDVFRYDKPQKDRYREFTQFGFEYIGVRNPIVDAEMIELAYRIYQDLGIKDIKLKLNSLGNIDEINHYRDILISYFSEQKHMLCDECKRRLVDNPLRILSCRNEFDKEIIMNAPRMIDCMSKDSLIRFEKVLKYLDNKNVKYEVDSSFIRGIDYQNDTIFEILSRSDESLSSNNLCSGGRYDNLYMHLCNKNIAAFGFDFGLERLISNIDVQNKTFFKAKQIDLFVVNLSDNYEYIDRLITILRKNNIIVEYDPRNTSYKSQLKFSDDFNAKYTAFIGLDEINNNMISLRNNSNNTCLNLDIKQLIDLLSNNNNGHYKVRSLKYES